MPLLGKARFCNTSDCRAVTLVTRNKTIFKVISLSDLGLAPWASRRRDLLELLDRLTSTISELTQQIEQEVEKYPAAQRLMTHPGVGALDGSGLRADHRRGGAVCVWQAEHAFPRVVPLP